MTPAKADLLGEQVDFRPNCDTELGRIAMPTVRPALRSPRGDNGGETRGVTADDQDRLLPQRSAVDPRHRHDRGRRVTRPHPRPTPSGFTNLYNQLFETYGAVSVVFAGSRADGDIEAAGRCHRHR
jgi:hypothetical protein